MLRLIPDEMLSERFLILMNKQMFKSGALTFREINKCVLVIHEYT